MAESDIVEKIILLQLRGYSAATGLRHIAESIAPTILSEIAISYYQNGPTEIASIVELLIESGKIVPTVPPSLWWPSAIHTLRQLDFGGYDVVGNPPRLVARNALTGTRGTTEITAPTQLAVDTAVKKLKRDMAARDHASRSRRSAQEEVDSE